MSYRSSPWKTEELSRFNMNHRALEVWCLLHLERESWQSIDTGTYKFVICFRDPETQAFFRLSNP